MLHQSAIEGYFAQQEDLLVEAVSRLVRIDSTLGPAQPGQPFGPGPAAALEAFLSLAQEWGLPGENLSGYVGTVDLNNQPDTALHILGHLDIVDAGEGWTVTAPFQPKVVDGLLYGRGTADDKGPMVAALLAMKAVRDLKLPLTKNVRLIAGTDEETGFRDIKWYYGSHLYAPHTLSPDADFPIINLEKGHYQPTFQAAWPQETALPRVAAFSGGTRLNMVPPKAQATVLGLSPRQVEEAFQALALEGAVTCTCTQEGESLHVACAGQNAHGSTPEEGHNAQTALVALLAALPLADCPSTRAIQALHALFPHGDHRGTALGIAAKTIAAMERLYGAKAEHIRAAIGPGISRCCFETDTDVPAAMRAALGAEVEPYLQRSAQDGKWHVDLKAINRHWMLRAGLAPEHIAVSGACTACCTDLYWSHRRMGDVRGSQAAMICLKETP